MSIKPTCREVHRLVSERLDRKLNVIERIRLRMHFMVCQACQNFDGQMHLLRRAMRQFEVPDQTDQAEREKR